MITTQPSPRVPTVAPSAHIASCNPPDRVTDVERRIAWVLEHPRTSPWLKAALEGALESDPVVGANEAELLVLLLRARCSALLRTALPQDSDGAA